MRSSGRRVLPRSIEEAARRLAAIERELEQILEAFPDLRRAPGRRRVWVSHRDGGVRRAGITFQLRGLRIH